MTTLPLLPRFDGHDVVSTVKNALIRLNYEATVSDLVVVTGIPVRYVEESLELLAHRFGGSYRVSKAGELTYRFPNGFHERRKELPSLRPRLVRIGKSAAAIAAALFKRWLLVLLGGYSAIFLTLLFPPVLIIFAILLGSWIRGDFLRVYDAGDSYGYRVRAAASCRVDSWRPIPAPTPGFSSGANGEKPLSVSAYESLFAYLFGDTRAKALRKRERLSTVLSFIGEQHGIVSLEEIMILTGMTHDDADHYITQLLLSYRGEPTVTACGTIVYEFPNLARADSAKARWERLNGDDAPRTDGAVQSQEEARKGTARTISTLNLFNLFFGVYYAALSLEYLTGKTPLGAAGNGANIAMSILFNSVYSLMTTSHLVHTVPIILLAFGVVPVGIASLFLLLHLRARRRHAISERAQRERQLRQQIYAKISAHPATVDPTKIIIEDPLDPGEMTRSEVTGVLDELAAVYDGEIEDLGDEHYVYHFAELARRLRDVDRRRTSGEPASGGCEDIAYDSRSEAT